MHATRVRHRAWVALGLLIWWWPQESVAQVSTVSYPKSLERAEQVAERVERFLDGKGEFDWRKLSTALDSAETQVAAYRSAQPDDPGALILTARLGRIMALLRPAMIGGGEGQPLVPDTVDHLAPLYAALDRALAAEPRLAEAQYWKAKLAGTVRPTMEDGDLVLRADWPRAVEFASKAVELAPADDRYRIMLGESLAQQGEFDRAREVLRDVDKGKHLLFLILEDFTRLPVPAAARRWTFGTEMGAEMFVGAPGELRAFGPERVRALVVPGSAEELEGFYRTVWSGFRLFSNEGEPSVFGQLLEPKGAEFVPAASARVLEGQEPPGQGIMLIVTQRHGLPAEERARYPEAVEADTTFCELLLINFRRK